MPSYNFQKQFVPKILDRSKPHTIRRRRKRPTRRGDTLSLYVGLRTRQCELIAMSDCVKVEPIIIQISGCRIFMGSEALDQNELKWDQVKELVHRDGFSNVIDFFDFFTRYDKDILDDFELIWWDVGDVFMPWMGTKGEIKMQLGKSADG